MQHAAWVIAPLVLVGVLSFSALTKWGKGELLRKIVRNLNLPDRLLPVPLARAMPGIELALAAGLLTPWRATFAVASGATLLLMLAYWALIARGLTITPRPSCGCFGQAGDHQVTRRTLLRNTALVSAAAASVSVAGSGHTLWSLVSDFTSADVLWFGLAALACLVTGLVVGRFDTPAPFTMTTHAAAPADTSEVEAHSHSPADADAAADAAADDYVRRATPVLLLHDPESGPVTLPELCATRAQLLVFVNCYCASTRDAIAELEGWQARLDLVDVRLVFSVPLVERALLSPPARSLVDHQGLTRQALGLTGSPSALLLGADGFLAGGPVSGADEVAAFIDDVEESLREAPALAEGLDH